MPRNVAFPGLSQDEVDDLIIGPILDVVKICRSVAVNDKFEEILRGAKITKNDFLLTAVKLQTIAALNTAHGLQSYPDAEAP